MAEIRVDVFFGTEPRARAMKISTGAGLTFHDGETPLFRVGLKELVRACVGMVASEGDEWAKRLLPAVTK